MNLTERHVRKSCHDEYWLIGLLSVIVEEVGPEKVKEALLIATPLNAMPIDERRKGAR